MNTYQTAFTVFYAIFWGAVFNVVGRWKAFDTGAWLGQRDPRARRRFWLAILCFNLLPALYYVIAFALLGTKSWSCPSAFALLDYLKLLPCILAAVLAPPGLYRVWLWKVQRRPTTYYPPYQHFQQEWKTEFPQLNPGNLNLEHAHGNCKAAWRYLLVSIGLLLLPPVLSYLSSLFSLLCVPCS